MAEEKGNEVKDEIKESSTTSRPKQSDITMAVLAHALGIFTSFVGALIIYLTSQKEGYAKTQAKEALNFQITVVLAYVIAGILTLVLVGILLIWAISIANLVLCIMAAVAVSRSENYKYPFNIRFIK